MAYENISHDLGAKKTAHAGGAPRETPPSKVVGILQRSRIFSDSLDQMIEYFENPLKLVVEDSLSPVEALVGTRPTLLFGTNNYLGLSFHPNCVRAASEALGHYGTGSTASRVAGGNHRLHLALEADIAALYGRKHAVVFSTGFMANLGVISALAQEQDVIFLDAHCHASILDACRLTGAKTRTFGHNDSDDLERLFRESGVPGSQTLVIVEGLYSVWGDLGDLQRLTKVAKRHGAVIVVDEAHAMGIYGDRGRGASEFLGVENDVDVIVGTFSKSVGAIGGYAVTDNRELRSLRFMSRSYLYTASLPVPVIAAAREAIALIANDPGLRAALWHNARALHEGLIARGIKPRAAAGPVGCIDMPGFKIGYDFWHELLKNGIYVNMLVPPATPAGAVSLRYSVSAAHTAQHIQTALDVFEMVARSLKII